jgi:CxxC motif-containing protein (DUF1111 family)
MKMSKGTGKKIVYFLSLVTLFFAFYGISPGAQGFFGGGGSSAVDPGVRQQATNAGSIVAGTSDPGVISFFNDGLNRFQEVETATNSQNKGLGPGFNSNQCSSCHAQPAVGGTSPAVNPQISVAQLDGADNQIPTFINLNGPVREARFVYGYKPNGRVDRESLDGGVHDLFTIAGRQDAPGCTTYAQPNFEQALAENNVIFRIPTPTFGLGLVENIPEATIVANLGGNGFITAQQLAALGIHGQLNRSGNDGTITRFGWKAQNKSLLIFAGEAYNVEMGISNELFPNKRGIAPPATPPSSCIFNPTPDDPTNFDAASSTAGPSDIVAFANFMRFLDQPVASCTGTGCTQNIQNGHTLFNSPAVGCAGCHTPNMITGQSSENPAMNGVKAILWSDLAVHHMGVGLADGVSQGGAGPDQFRSALLWGLGQRIFFLHDGRTSDLVKAIEDHASPGSEANQSIQNFNRLSKTEQQELVDFLRTL